MFSKANKASPKPEASGPAPDAPRRAPKAASLVSEDITIEGNINGEGELHVDGVIRGDVHVAKLTIGETGHIEGAVHAEAVEVRGRVIGSISAKLVRLCPTAYVDGDVTHEQLAIEAGAFFQGRSLKFQRSSTQVPTAALSAPESPPELTAQSA
jgi:cytoskeletal protein CcmA (bactofilin family)